MSDPLDAEMMRRAIVVAEGQLGRTAPNPSVGCVIVKDGRVIAVGGRPHAEEQALAMIGPQARGAVVYVTLEPCGHRSAGGLSCSERLAAAGVARVVFACDNPDALSCGVGPERMRAAGVPVEAGLLAQETAARLYAWARRS